MKIGIGRGLFFYDYYMLWKTFFTELGAEVILSPETNKNILNDGVLLSVDDSCLPVKIFHGHINYLKDKVDYIFLPKLKSVHRKEYECPKIIGLPEMIKNSVDNLPEIISPKINYSIISFNKFKPFLEAGKYVTNNIVKINLAYRKAINEYNRNLDNHRNGFLPINITDIKRNTNKNDISIFVVGHGYNIYDSYLSMNLISKLIKENVNVVVPQNIDEENINYYASKLSKKMFWTLGRQIIGSSYNVIYEKKVDGIIYISSFGCGLDSILIELIQRVAVKEKIPFTLLTVDEHTGEAGINTRIEAFLDMIKWRADNENNISTHG